MGFMIVPYLLMGSVGVDFEVVGLWAVPWVAQRSAV
jgi:hypothetical protein